MSSDALRLVAVIKMRGNSRRAESQLVATGNRSYELPPTSYYLNRGIINGMSTLTIADVERIAALAQLELTDEEKQLFTRQLADILSYAEQLQAIDTTGVPATAHVNAAPRAEREDEPRPSLAIEDAVANAPDGSRDAGMFRVPRVIG